MASRFAEWQLEDYLRTLWLNKWLIAALGLAFGVSSALTMAQKPDLYRTYARVLIDPQTPRVVQFQELSTATSLDRSFLQTEYELISGRAVMARVLEELNLESFPPFSGANDPIQILQGMIFVESVRGTRLVNISSAGTDPELITRIANSTADNYVRLNLGRRIEMTTGGAHWLREEVDKMEEKTRQAQMKLLEFREQHGTLDLGEENQSSNLQRIQALQASLGKTRDDRMAAEQNYREKHPIFLELMAKERELQMALFDQEQRALEISRLSIHLNVLFREAKVSESIYNVLLTRLKELSVQEGLQNNNVSIVDYARVPATPVGPARRRKIATSSLLGLLLGGVLGFAREFLTQTIRTRQEFEQALEIPFLGHVPSARSFGRPSRHGASPRIPLNPSDSAVTEALRSIRTTLEFLLPADTHHLLVITSTLPEEGKSFLCANLAIGLVERKRHVLIIDGDLHRPTLHRYFGADLEPGLSSFLQESAGEEELIRPVPNLEGLFIVTAGLTPSQPTDLLTQPKCKEFLQKCKEQFQYVLIDSPPVLVAADAAVLSSLADGTIYIVRANRTHSEAAGVGKQRLTDVGAKLIGGILNRATLDLERGYRYYYSNRYYREGKRRSPKTRLPRAANETVRESEVS